MSLKKIALITCVSKKIGLGHIKRLIFLWKELRLKKNIWIISGNKDLIRKIIKSNNRIYIIPKFENKKILNILNKNQCNKAILDISHKDNLKNNKIFKIQSFLKKNNIKLISFDLPAQSKIISDISIIPYEFNKKINKKQSSKLFKGYNYIFTKVNRNKIESIKKIKKVLIVISGTDPFNIAYKIYPLIKDLPYTYKVILGENSSKLKIKEKKKGDKFLKYSDKILKDIKNHDAIICGEGLIKFESILMRKPTILIHQFDNSSDMIKNFLREKFVYSLGLFKYIDKQQLKFKIYNYLSNLTKIEKNRLNINNYFKYKIMNYKKQQLLKNIRDL